MNHAGAHFIPLQLTIQLPFSLLPSLLCLLFYDVFSHHAYVFLFVGVNPAAEMATQEEMATQKA